MVATTFLLNFLFLCFLIYWVASGHELFWPGIIYAATMIHIWTIGRRLKKRVAQLVEATAQRLNLKRVDPRRSNKPSAEKPEEEASVGGSDVSPQPSEVSPQPSPVSPQP
jgi:hypothetical protein